MRYDISGFEVVIVFSKELYENLLLLFNNLPRNHNLYEKE